MFCLRNKSKSGTTLFRHGKTTAQRLLIVALGLLLVCCSQKKRNRTVYYPMDSLMTEQVNYLSASTATVRKITVLGEKSDTVLVAPKDSKGWIKELDIFRELDAINKPIYLGKYTVEEDLSDSRSNLKIRSFTGAEDLPIAFLKIYYQGTPDRVRRIEAEYKQANSMYKGSRFLSLEFEEIYNKPVLTSYSITGGQKMFLGDTVRYTVYASVNLP